MPTDFDDMEKAEVTPYWVNLREDGGYDLVLEKDDEMETVSERDEPLVGVVTEVKENVGQNNSRLYVLKTPTDPRPLNLWGAGHLNAQFDSRNLGVGDEIGVRLTGDTFDTERGEATEYDLRFSKV